jgi:hypothetical protein
MLHEAIRELYNTAVLIQGNTVDNVVVKDDNGDEVSIVAEDVTAKITELKNASAYKIARQVAYPALAEQFDKLWHDINNGTLDNTGAFYTALKTVKDDNPKPGE